MPSLGTLAASLTSTIGEKKSDVLIEELDEQDKPQGTALRFQYFPETIADTKSVNWSPKEIPGGSLPLYQWIGSGARSVSFTALFTADVDISSAGQGSDFKSQSIRDRLKSVSQDTRNVDIRAAIYWLRRFMLPRYADKETQVGVPLTSAPHKLRLYMPGTGIGYAGGVCMSAAKDSFICVMQACDVSWEAFFPSGMPRIASVSLSFAQLAQYQGMVDFPSASGLDGESGDTASYSFGYSLRKNK